MKKDRSGIKPKDNIVEFDQIRSPQQAKRNDEIAISRVIRFESLPISGWHDESGDLDKECKQSCVRDCSCVNHCTWVIA